MNQAVSKNDLPKIHCFATVTSCLDVAFELISEGRLDAWDSVLAKIQTSGRGQMRRHWASLEGNLFVAIRLPEIPLFKDTAAASAIAALCANALRSYGDNIMLKWPNDLILCNQDGMAKLAGVLVEEKHGKIVAGIGINIFRAPGGDEPGMAEGIPAGCLAQLETSEKLPFPHELWLLLVKHLYSVYKNGPRFSEIWQHLAEELLLWRGYTVDVIDGEERVTGKLLGIGHDGCAVIKTDAGIVDKYSGTMRLVHNDQECPYK